MKWKDKRNVFIISTKHEKIKIIKNKDSKSKCTMECNNERDWTDVSIHSYYEKMHEIFFNVFM